MRDTYRLRTKLALLACLPSLAIGAGACSDPPMPEKSPAKAADAKKRADRKAADGKKTNSAATKPRMPDRKPVRPHERPVPKHGDNRKVLASAEDVSPEEARLMPIPGDPPFIDGYNPEEETCPSGNWCGNTDTAMALAPRPEHAVMEMDCPTRIAGGKGADKITGAKYDGLSSNPAMQGTLNEHGTELARSDGQNNACCYHWFDYCSGRPLLDGEEATVADVVERVDWGAAACETPALPHEIRTALADAWSTDARYEHASIAAFARTILELMAVGAPPELLEGASRAAEDEIEHAKRCFALASRYAGSAVGPAALPALAPRPGGLVAVAVAAFVEGCVGETTAALVAERALAAARDEQVVATLERIAHDEARHAAHAWQTVAWALRVGGPEVADALRSEAARVRPTAPLLDVAEHPLLAAHGRLSSDAQRRTAQDAVRDIVRPMLASLLDTARSPEALPLHPRSPG